jgi:class 3 adenylate cyclase
LRVAVNTGEVIASEGSEIIGDPVNVAARLQEQARDSDVVIGESTRRLVSDLVTLAPVGALALKGRSAAVGAYRVVSLDRPRARSPRRSSAARASCAGSLRSTTMRSCSTARGSR